MRKAASVVVIWILSCILGILAVRTYADDPCVSYARYGSCDVGGKLCKDFTKSKLCNSSVETKVYPDYWFCDPNTGTICLPVLDDSGAGVLVICWETYQCNLDNFGNCNITSTRTDFQRYPVYYTKNCN